MIRTVFSFALFFHSIVSFAELDFGRPHEYFTENDRGYFFVVFDSTPYDITTCLSYECADQIASGGACFRGDVNVVVELLNSKRFRDNVVGYFGSIVSEASTLTADSLTYIVSGDAGNESYTVNRCL